ncbi:hypothetical protein OVA24_18660 [Luteolibacter sp. SL250]|uniref:hypothetical protein n=1 Tax=Luteolibacter sp. SL250 TaxID=2995170 RepID=UPI0022704221|nr:hypothetical protein [Luteolibacter sp. SL250]WAC19251.1 hypothetical protein OVA24_18660 [Luteolibacter sp. SL250]
MNEERVTVAFLTGQSDPRTSALSPVQQRFLDQSPVTPEQRLDLNFPYRNAGRWSETNLLRASFNNARQYLACRRPSFAETHRPSVVGAFGSTGKVVILAGSCGLELLVNLRLPEGVVRRLHVFAYGPVSRSLPRCASLVTVRGNRDLISRWWHPRVDHVISCGHMDYLEREETMALFCAFHQRVTGGGGR